MNKEFYKIQKLAGLITETQYRQLNENDSINISGDQVKLQSDSGEYVSFIEKDGNLTFELILSDMGDTEYMNDQDVWNDHAPEVFKKIADAGGEWYVDGDTVGIKTTLDKLKELFIEK